MSLFASALEKIRKDQPSVEAVHIAGTGVGTPPQRRRRAQVARAQADDSKHPADTLSGSKLRAALRAAGKSVKSAGGSPGTTSDLAELWLGKAFEAVEETFSVSFPIQKAVDDQMLVYGWASVTEKNGAVVFDGEDDSITIPDLQKAAHDFITNERHAGDVHFEYGPQIGYCVESMVFTPEIQKALGIDLKKIGWFVCMKVNSPEVWAKIKSGVYKSFSIGGVGRRVSLAA